MRINYLQIERALSGFLPFEELKKEERTIFQAEKPAFEIGRMAERFAQGYYAHTAASIVARDPNAKNLLTSIQENQPVPTETVVRKNGSAHVFDSHDYLDYFNSPAMAGDIAKIWLMGSLLSLGDALDKNAYFDRAPELELVRHLRNGVAHGNCFNITNDGKKSLAKFPAHNRNAKVRFSNVDFKITADLNGMQVLFDFMGPGDVLDLLQSVGVRLTRLREKDGLP